MKALSNSKNGMHMNKTNKNHGKNDEKNREKSHGMNDGNSREKNHGKNGEKNHGKNGVKSREKINEKKHGKCPIFDKCGGCQYIDLSYDKQLDLKRKMLSDLLKEFGKVDNVIAMESPYNYRNKVTATFHHKRNGEIVAGIYEEGTHNVLENSNCLIENKDAQRIILAIKDLVKSFKITVHNEDTGYGILRHVMIRTAHKTGQIMVVIVTSVPTFPSKKNFCKALLDICPNITTIVQNINEKKTTMVLGERNQIMYGKGFIEDVLCGKRFRISPNSFYQVNPVQTQKLYETAIDFASLSGNEVVIDAYCGTGTIGIALSDKAKNVIGVELNKEAIKDAIINAKMNASQNVRFYNNDAGKFMFDMANKGEVADVVIMDPPRSGSTEKFIDSVIKLSPERVVYISCGPQSLARDLKYFYKRSNYRVMKIVGCDMFPWTEHVETVALLSKEIKNAKDHIEFTLDEDDLEVTSAEQKASYREIREYILNKHGKKVHSLYIAQVKQKLGIIERINYNKSKKGDEQVVPVCPADKEELIVEALKHFKMI